MANLKLLAGAIERGVKVQHEGHEHRVVGVNPLRLGPAIRR